ncbi:cytochrome P450 [Geopyxis carbonaria]|nr:cytochrome P450 [Geopyxis carbonaria]
MYGSLVTVWTGRRPTIVIGDPQVACELLDKRSAIYSSRPRFVVMGELFTNNDSLLTMPHGDKWRKTRKIFHSGLLRRACDSYQPIQTAESQRLARDLVRNPAAFGKHLERYAASVMVCVAYGRRVDDLDDDIVRQIYERMQYMATLNVPGAYWAESFPLLKHVPDCLAPWKREVKQRAAASSALLLSLARDVRSRMARGTAPPSFTKTLWEKYDATPGELTEREIAYATGSLFGAGSDTSSATLMSFVLAMTAFPRVAEKAQEELDRVVGRDRAPTWADEPQLPYCAAVIKETLRWRPVAVMGGTPHASVRDDYYAGHFIPKGSTILGNLWAIHHNEKYFHDSHEFMPERYLQSPAQNGVLPYPHRDGHSAFGWGRRICPGKTLAEASLFISITRILWGFTIAAPVDPATGESIRPDTFAYTDGFNSKPKPFRCVIAPRSPEIQAVIERDAADADQFLERYRGDDDE